MHLGPATLVNTMYTQRWGKCGTTPLILSSILCVHNHWRKSNPNICHVAYMQWRMLTGWQGPHCFGREMVGNIMVLWFDMVRSVRWVRVLQILWICNQETFAVLRRRDAGSLSSASGIALTCCSHKRSIDSKLFASKPWNESEIQALITKNISDHQIISAIICIQILRL